MSVQTLDFAAGYDARIVSTPTGQTRLRLFQWKRARPVGDTLVLEAPSDALLVEVTPDEGGPRQGAFLQGLGGISGLFATPSPTTLCVVAGGQGYWVPVLTPTDFLEIRCNPVKSVFAVPGRNIVVFASYTELTAYGPSGILWLADRLSWDGLTITEVTTRHVRGLGWDSPANCEVPFVVDVDTGEFEGGSSPEHYARAN
jgi:hypothetical protein